ncbi:hypothetical protein BY458DRAFT_555014 [Sporodiniella umbellata]|nr:hypothetical protein BY458DRAFT_555014 [Sporodiniella umbellata]
MPKKWTSLFAGVGLTSLVTCQTRIGVWKNTAQVQAQIDETKSSADQLLNQPSQRISLHRTPTSFESAVQNNKSLYQHQIVPLVKASWNSQIAQLSFWIIQSNLPTKSGKFILRNVFGVHD